jgi:hypothetical protein
MQDFQSRIWQGDQFIKSAQKQDLVFWWLQILLECSTNLRELSPIRGKCPSFFFMGPFSSYFSHYIEILHKWAEDLYILSELVRGSCPGSDDARITVAPRTSGTRIARRSSGLQANQMPSQ